MSAVLSPFAFRISVLTGWLNERQTRILEFLQKENRLLRHRLGRKRLRLTDGDRRRLAAKGSVLGRKLLEEIATIAHGSGA